MSKTKPSGAISYEILYIISNKFSEEEAEKISEQIQKIIADTKANIVKIENIGKKPLAYEIKGNEYGYYTLIVFDSETKNIATIDRLIRQMHEILRYLIVRYIPRRIISAPNSSELRVSRRGGLAEEAPAETKPEKNKQEKNLDEKLEEEDLKEKTENKQKPEEKKEKEAKNLDEKLEEILDAKNLF